VISWGDSRRQLLSVTREFGVALQTLLRAHLPWYDFLPVPSEDELRAVLLPWKIRDSIEVRRRLLRGERGQVTYGPLAGVFDADFVGTQMLAHAGRVMVAVRVEPVEINDELRSWLWGHLKPHPIGDISVCSLGAEGADLDEPDLGDDTLIGDALRSLMVSYSLDPPAQRLWLRKRWHALQQRAYQLQVQMAGDRALDPALCAMVAGEVAGPGTLTAEFAWPNPDRVVAGGADWVRVRPGFRLGVDPSASMRRISAMRLAEDNLRYVLFRSLCAEARCGCAPRLGDSCAFERLADLGEVTRIFGLPSTSPWRPLELEWFHAR
jgi:hypothetical protein